MLSKIVSLFEKIGTIKSEKELERMGYTKEYLKKLANENLKDWV
jgi:hypothetical protein